MSEFEGSPSNATCDVPTMQAMRVSPHMQTHMHTYSSHQSLGSQQLMGRQMRLLLMCGSKLSEGVEVLEEDRGEPGGSKRREDVVMQIRNFLHFAFCRLKWCKSYPCKTSETAKRLQQHQ